MASDAGHTQQSDEFVRRRGALLLTFCAALLTIPLWSQPLTGHSQVFNLVWQEGFADGMRAGLLYPRWLETTNQGLGSPSFYFYAPLPFWVATLLDLVTKGDLSPAAYVSGSVGLSIWCSGMAMLRFLRPHFTPTSALIAAVLYMALPYHLGIDVWWRAAVGELWGFVWPPLLLHGTVRLWQQERWGWTWVVAATVGVTFSHLPSFLITVTGSGILMLIVLTVRQDPRRVLSVASRVSLAIVAGCAITAGYWLPALATLDLTDVNGFMTVGQFNYARNFIPSLSLWPTDQRVQVVGLVTLATLGQLHVLGNRFFPRRPWTFNGTLWFTVVLMLLITPLSEPVWILLAPLQRIQFPWRFLLLIDVAIVVMCAHLLDAPHAKNWRRASLFLLPILCIAAGAAWSRLMPPEYTKPERRIMAVMAVTRADAREYRTRWTSEKFYSDVRRDTLRMTHETFSGRLDQLLPSADWSTTLLHHRFFYPDLRAVDARSGRPLPVRPQALTGLTLVELPSPTTSVRYEHVLLPEERLGWLVSLAGLLLAAVAVGWEYRRPASRRPDALTT